jgi:hypothetical protein
MDDSKNYEILYNSLSVLEAKIFAHAKLNQVMTVESFLNVVLSKSNLTNKLTMVSHWNENTIKENYIYIILSPQNEIPNMATVEAVYSLLTAKEFRYVKFLKYVEEMDVADDYSFTVGDDKETTVVKLSQMKFNVAKFKADAYGRKIRLVVYVDEILDKLLKPTESGDHWIPDNNLFYALDMLIGEYHMTKNIATVNFFPRIILNENADVLDVHEVKRTINDLLGVNVNYCSVCKCPSYRAEITLVNDKLKCLYCE